MLVKYIRESERYWLENEKEMALVLALLAIAATSRKRYPRKKGFSDSGSFKKMIHDHSRTIMSSTGKSFPIANIQFEFGDRGNSTSLGEIFYNEYRNNLFHEATLPEKVSLSASKIVDGRYQAELKITREIIEIPDFFILRLIKIVRDAPENEDCTWS